MSAKLFKTLTILTLVLCLCFMVEAANIEKGPYLIFPGSNTQMTVLYQLDGVETCSLEWGTDTSYSTGSVLTSEYGTDHQHKYTISSLTPGTKYYYRVSVGGTWYPGSFRAAPAASVQNLKFLAYGDTRSYPADHDAVAARMIQAYTSDPAYQTITLHAGDWVNSADIESDWTNQFFDRGYTNITSMQANLPIQGCMGNHEQSGTVYEKYYPYPYEPGGRYWSFDYGPLHVAIVDQYVSYTTGSTQHNWLTNDLANTTKEWKVLVFHEPGWSAGGHSNEADVQQHIQPLCTQYGVDLVFCGHNHYYARCLVNGVHHITVGGGGAPLYAPSSNADYLVTATQVHHHAEIAIDGEQLDFIARDRNGNVIDSFSVSHVFVPQLPWSDGFESGNLTSGGWFSSGTVTAENDAYSGSYAARTNRAAWLEKSISTETFSNIHLKYARKTAGLEAGEYLLVEWYDGSSWHQIEQTADTAWSLKDIALPAGADNNKFFKVRFTAVGADNKEYTYIDAVEIVEGTSGPDTTPPTPDPMSFASAPAATGTTSISMTAATASDPSGVEYYFECTAGGGHDSGWQDGATYEDTGLQPDTTYTYRVKARDKSANLNETAFSSTASATTQSSGGAEIYVADIAMSSKKAGSQYGGIAQVLIKDSTGANVEGATVYATWSGSVSATVSGVTGADGTVTFQSSKVKGGGTFTITITNVVKSGFTYNSSLNVETSDSITAP